MFPSLQTRLKKAGRWLPLALLPLLPFAAQAQAPANDNPSGATALPLAATCTPVNTTNAGATTTVVTGLGYTNPGCGIAASPKDVWFTFTTNATGAGSTAAIIQVAGTVAGQVRAFSTANGATGPFTQIGCAAGTTNNTQAGPLSLFGLTPSTTYYIFVSGYGSGDTQGAFTICATTVPNNDATVTTIQTLGAVSSTYGSPVTVRAVVRNVGGAAQTALPVTLTVAGATTFTNTQTIASLAPGASATVTFATYPVTTAGVNTLTVSVPADDNTTNNSLPYSQTVSAGTQGYVDTTQPFAASGVGIGAANGVLAARYTSNGAAAVTNITPTFQGAGTAGVTTTYQLQVYAGTATGPGALLYTSAVLTRPTVTGPVPTAIPSIPVTGDFFVAVKELDNNVALANQVEDPLRAAAFYYTTTGGTTWIDVNTTTLKTRLALGVTLSAPAACSVPTGLAVSSITTTSASLAFTAPAGATGYIVTYTPTGGTATTVTPAPTASPVALTGLTGGTTYTVSVTTNCGAGQTSAAVTTTFTTLPTPPANDDCANAIALPVGATCTNTVGTDAGATASPATVPAPTCGGAALGPLADVWFTVTVPASGNVTVTTSAATGSPLTDTVVELYSGTCGALTSISCNDDNAAGAFSTVALTGQTVGATLYVRVRSYNTTATGQFNICATNPAVVTVPANDNPTGAITLPVAATCTPVSGTNVGATTTTPSGYTNPGCGIAVSPIDVWYKFTTAATGVGSTYVNVQVAGAPAGQVRVFSAATSAGPFTEVGCAAGTTNNTVAGPLRVAGLTPNTTYYVFVSGYGSGDTTGPFTICVTGLATPAGPTYATLPFAESFEGPWVDVFSTRDAPTVSWRNTPASGNASWRRDDDGTAAGWASNSGAFTPASSTGAHSARFHSYDAASGATGSLDLYVNLSSPGSKTLTFDYMNTSGTDKVDVLVSTDAGATFSTTPVLTANTNAAFTAKTVAIASTSATTVIRFRATSDFGNDDIGIDNVQLRVLSATRNDALAATVGLYPNPAHRSFTLSVPAGSLHAASARLLNSLGQVVQSRQLNLPVTGGNADFDVTSLAAGVYSLQLKTGETLVVKRVVIE